MFLIWPIILVLHFVTGISPDKAPSGRAGIGAGVRVRV